MTRRRTSTPWDLDIRTTRSEHDDQDDHAEILIHASCDDPAPTWTYTQTLAGYRWCAGILGRLAVTLNPHIERARHEHGCHRLPDQCRAGGDIDDIPFDPGPALWINIPDHALEHWTSLVTTTLNTLLERERWQPTADDETTWTGNSNVTSIRTRNSA